MIALLEEAMREAWDDYGRRLLAVERALPKLRAEKAALDKKMATKGGS